MEQGKVLGRMGHYMQYGLSLLTFQQMSTLQQLMGALEQMPAATQQNVQVLQNILKVRSLDPNEQMIIQELIEKKQDQKIDPRKLEYLMNRAPNTETGKILKGALALKDKEVDINELREAELPGSSAASSSQTPAPVNKIGLQSRTVDGGTFTKPGLRIIQNGSAVPLNLPDVPGPAPQQFPPALGKVRIPTHLHGDIADITGHVAKGRKHLPEAQLEAYFHYGKAQMKRGRARERSSSAGVPREGRSLSEAVTERSMSSKSAERQ
jgi:hypothetical protein